jgi:hypothetical protein
MRIIDLSLAAPIAVNHVVTRWHDNGEVPGRRAATFVRTEIDERI